MHVDNHYVAKVYLKRWANQSGRVWTYRILVSNASVPLWKLRSTKGLAYHRHLYTRTSPQGETDVVERWLDSEFESPAEEVIEKAVSHARLTATDWETLIRFLAAQDVRTPARFSEMVERWREELPTLLEKSLQKSVAEMEAAIRSGAPPRPRNGDDTKDFPAKVTTERRADGTGGTLRVETVAGRALWLFYLRRLLTHTVQALLNHRWTVLHSPGVSWVTSDNPVVRLNYHGPKKYDFGGGWGSKGTEIFLPLSPKHLLYTKVGFSPPRRGTVVDDTFAHTVQKISVAHAHRFVFAKDAPDPYVATHRPRVVSATQFAFESEQWERWHDEQTAAERALQK